MFKAIWEFIKSLFRKPAPLPPPLAIPQTPYEWAIRELGQSEIYGDKHNPRIVWYHSFTTGKFEDDETAWCASFMSAATDQTGYKSLHNAWARSWANYGEKGTGEVGEIVVFTRHVGFVAEKYDGGPTVLVLGGNQSNAVTKQRYSVGSDTVFRKPVKA